MSKLIAQSVFMSLPQAEQVAYVLANGKDFSPESGVMPSAADDLFKDAPITQENDDVDNKYDIDGDAVYANITIIIAGEKFRLQGQKITEKRNCMTGWDKTAKEFTKENADVMSVIDMVRTYGAAVVNANASFEVTLGKAGESNTAKRDPLAALLSKAEAPVAE